MSFLTAWKNKIRTLPESSSHNHFLSACAKRISLCVFRGSLTLEASLVVPLFLFFGITMCTLIEQYRTYCMMSEAASQIGNTICVDNQYLLSSQIESRVAKLVGAKADEIQVRDLFYLDGSVNFELYYREKYRLNIWGAPNLNRFVRYCGHQWVGYNLKFTDIRDGEEYVFVTENGGVYHRSRNCTHLMLSIESAVADELPRRYLPCERCQARKTGIVYITEEGERFHSLVECSSLKRKVRAVPISQVGTYRECSRCGGGE